MKTLILKLYFILIAAFEVDHVSVISSREFKLLFKLQSFIKAIKRGCFLCNRNMIYVVRKYQILVVYLPNALTCVHYIKTQCLPNTDEIPHE